MRDHRYHHLPLIPTTTDNSRSDNTETPLIIPDISPTYKDLDDAMTDGDRGTTVPDAKMMMITIMIMMIRK